MSKSHASTPAVLLVEDSLLHRRILGVSLRKLGYNVVEAGTPSEALGHLSRSSFAAVFLDWHFPEGTGEALARHLRDHHTDTHVIITSSDDSTEMSPLFRQSGALHVIGKNFTTDALRAALPAAHPAHPSHPPSEPPAAETISTSPTPEPPATSGLGAALTQELASLRTALDEGRVADARRAAHNLHGIAKFLALDALSRASREMQLALLVGDPAEPHFRVLSHEIEKASESSAADA